MHKGIGVSVALAAVMVMTFGAPASATHGGPHPTFKNQTEYFQCLAGNRVQNVPRNSGAVPTWGPTAPTAALAAGGGCVQYENLLTNTGSFTSPWDLAFEGTYTGNLKQLTFEIYLANGPSASIGEGTANATLLIDGEAVHTATQTTFTPEAAGDIKKIVFSYTKLDKRFGLEDGDGTTERQIGISWGSFNEQQNLFAWGATDAPSKIVFNPATTPGMKFPVN
jgi:hypothetical protein